MKKLLMTILAMLTLASPALPCVATFARIKTWSNGDTLTAGDLNAEYNNILNNLNPTGICGDSEDLTTMRATANPYPGGAVSMAVSMKTEVEQLRYQILGIKQAIQGTSNTYWYETLPSSGTFTIVGTSIGVNTISPSVALDIRGQMKITGVAGPGNGPVLNVSTGSAKLFEITSASATFNVPVFQTQVSTISELWLYGANGHGSTNTAIKRFSSVMRSTGTAMSYAGDNSVLGTSVTVNQSGLYDIVYCEDSNSGIVNFGVSINSSQLATSIQNINSGDRVLLNQVSGGTNTMACVSGIISLFANDIVRPHDDPIGAGVQASTNYFKMVKVAP